MERLAKVTWHSMATRPSSTPLTASSSAETDGRRASRSRVIPFLTRWIHSAGIPANSALSNILADDASPEIDRREDLGHGLLAVLSGCGFRAESHS